VEKQLRVAINAQLPRNNGSGGVESVLIGLIHALGQLEDGTEEYIIVGPQKEFDWLKPFTGPNQRIVKKDESRSDSKQLKLLKRCLNPLRPIARRCRNYLLSSHSDHHWPKIPISDGFFESLNCQVIHFPYQHYELSALPTIYNPHDLQHLHYPQFFKPTDIAWRESIYREGCHFAQTIAVASKWIKNDIVLQYHVSPDKIQVIPWAPPTEAHIEPKPDLLTSVREKYQLSLPFAFYPAMIWEHKNHIRLLEALALLRDKHALKVNLVCTGAKHNFWPPVEQRLFELGLQEQVKFLGIVPHEELRAFYRLSQFVIIPTLFEAASGPLFEAWQDHIPVVCSTVTSLPEQAGDAALLFDPLSVKSIADAIAQIASNHTLREDLRYRGIRRLQNFSWERTAKAYRAVYRRAARFPLTEEDHWLLGWDWMQKPEETAVHLR
jgi:glycosyltransferase involved in cell wall biosynthesis